MIQVKKYTAGIVLKELIDLTFNEDGTGCILATSDAADGEIISKIISVSFDSKKINGLPMH